MCKENLYERIKVLESKDAGFPAFHKLIQSNETPYIYLKNLIETNEVEAESFITQLEQAQALIEKESQVSDLHSQMTEDIYGKMELLFQTKNDVSVSATVATWEAMLKRPENYISEELQLSDVNAVVAYATDKLAQADQYGVFRFVRIQQFYKEREILLNS